MAFSWTFEKADSLWPAKLVRCAAEELAFAQTAGGQFADPLSCVAEERHLPPRTNRQRFTPGLEHAGFVVGGHDRDQPRTRMSHLFRQPIQINDAFPRDGNQPMPFRKIMFRGRHHARVFDGRDPYFRLRRKCAREMMQHRVVGLRRSGSPDQVERVAAENVRNPLPHAGDSCVRAAADTMGTGGIADEFLSGVQPGLPRFRQHRCCCVVVEVDHAL